MKLLVFIYIIARMTRRNPKGSVTVEAYRNRLRLRLPRQVFAGQKQYLSLGLSDTPINRKIAEAKAKLIESDIALERFDLTLSKYKNPQFAPTPDCPDLVSLWDKYVEFKSKSVAQSTIDKDFKKTRNHIAALPTQKILEARTIRNHLANNLTLNAARRTLTQIKACCNWAVDEGLISESPFVNLAIRSRNWNEKDIDPFTAVEQERIIEAFENHPVYRHYSAFVKFLFLTGARTSEAIGLQWLHISPDLKFITFSEALVLGKRGATKTHRTRRFPVNNQLRELLISIKPPESNPEALVFTSQKGCAIDSHNFLTRAWKPVLESIQIRYRTQYNTRHTFISLCLEAGVPVAQVAAWSGNSPRTIYNSYAGIVSLIEVPEF